MKSISTLKDRISILEDQALLLTRIINDAPPGYLASKKCPSGKYKYVLRETLESGKVKETFIPKKDIAIAAKLANKVFARKKLQDINAELAFIKAEVKFLSHKSQEVLFREQHPGMIPLLYNDYPNPEAKALDWGKQAYNRNKKYPESIKYPTVLPELKVRSKSEADIISLLTANGIPFHYDEIIMINGNEIAIDLVCMNPRTNAIWYWDHRGMMDDESYIEKTLFCEKQFYKEGIIPWKNMIVTTETKDSPLDIQWVQHIIDYYLK